MARRSVHNDDLSWMRKATRVLFHNFGDRSILQVEVRRVISGRTHRILHAVPVASEVQARTDTPKAADATHWRCYASIDGTTDQWRTVVNALRNRDKLTLMWVASNNNANLRSVGYHADELHLEAADSGGSRRSWLLEYQIGPQSPARMVVDAGEAPGMRQPRPIVKDAWMDALSAIIAGSARKTVVATVAADVAHHFGDTVQVGDARVTVYADAERDDDELVMLDSRWSTAIGQTWVPNQSVFDAGAMSPEFYRSLRANGTSIDDAEFFAVEAAGDAHAHPSAV